VKWIALVVMAGLLIGCGEATTDAQKRVRVQNITYKLHPGGARIITGEVKNLSDQYISIAQVDISLFDSDNRKVESMNVVVRDIAIDSLVSFREPVHSDFDVRGARARAVFLP